MQIKRFTAANIRDAMRMVKDELGPDAVIMSNRSVPEGVEIVAARDFDANVVRQNALESEGSAKRVEQKLTNPLPMDFADLAKGGGATHIVPSVRKRDNEQERPQRRDVEQYVGYSEKMPARQQPQAAVNRQEAIKLRDRPTFGMDAAKPKQDVHPEMAKAQKANEAVEAKVEIDKIMADVKKDLRQEMKQEMLEMRQWLGKTLPAMLPRPETDVATPSADDDSVYARLFSRLSQIGFSKKVSSKIANRLGTHAEFDIAYSKAQEMLSQIVPIATDDDLLDSGGIVALLGPTGIGKTTTIAKLASQFVLRHGNHEVALISTDNYRIGAHEQIHIYGRILGVPVKIANNADELHQYIRDFQDKKLVLIDTVGMSQRDIQLAEKIRALKSHRLPIRPYLVMPASTHYRTAMEIMRAFQSVRPQAAILTKLDEANNMAMALSALTEKRLPLAFITDGQHVPEDIYAPEGVSLIKHCIDMFENEQSELDFDQDDWSASYA